MTSAVFACVYIAVLVYAFKSSGHFELSVNEHTIDVRAQNAYLGSFFTVN